MSTAAAAAAGVRISRPFQRGRSSSGRSPNLPPFLPPSIYHASPPPFLRHSVPIAASPPRLYIAASLSLCLNKVTPNIF